MYLDDIVLFSKFQKDHIEQTTPVLCLLIDVSVTLKFKKSDFLLTEQII